MPLLSGNTCRTTMTNSKVAWFQVMCTFDSDRPTFLQKMEIRKKHVETTFLLKMSVGHFDALRIQMFLQQKNMEYYVT